MFSSEELRRYNRHIILPEFGMEGQQKLKTAKVAVIGAGGLGCPVLMYLAAAGIGTLGIIDGDIIEESNLQRQVLYSQEDVRKSKAETAAAKLKKSNPYINVIAIEERLTSDNALEILKNYDIIVDGTDNFSTRYLSNDASIILNKPLVSASIFKFEGQLSVYNYKGGPSYRCLFSEPPAPGEMPSCSEVGVIGVLPGVIGSLQANEVIKIITGIGEPLSGKLLIFDLLSLRSSTISFQRNEENFAITSLGNYDFSCELPELEFEPGYKELTVQELKAKLDKKDQIFLLDVREEYEYEICNLGGKLIPVSRIQQQVDQIPENIPVVVYCHLGMRSAMVVKFLTEEFGFKNLYNLEGGIHAWSKQIDSNVPVY
ncbi:molybdopterin-synthase adenylyltransferase MoeB [Sporocytophaga myxococcoides]|uniref:molybdopterin-synthase adenylyltransferase MoeB n=1 Tax=Sporocytophaga myxococcoides TaxID=153721 RepID=UPI00042968D5|nr:molybdopterin-synthase adenylyltransferase MoeB [Sporocytophaga myxococcoides]